MRLENANFQASVASQLTQQISAELAPIFTQVDRLTLQVEHGQTHAQFAESSEHPNVWVNPEERDEEDYSDAEMNTGLGLDGFAPVKGKRGKGKGKSIGMVGGVYSSNVMKKTGGG